MESRPRICEHHDRDARGERLGRRRRRRRVRRRRAFHSTVASPVAASRAAGPVPFLTTPSERPGMRRVCHLARDGAVDALGDRNGPVACDSAGGVCCARLVTDAISISEERHRRDHLHVLHPLTSRPYVSIRCARFWCASTDIPGRSGVLVLRRAATRTPVLRTPDVRVPCGRRRSGPVPPPR